MKPMMDFRMLSVKPKFSVGCQVFSTWSVNWVHISGISSCPLFLLVVVQLAVAVVSEDRVGQEELLVSIPEQGQEVITAAERSFGNRLLAFRGIPSVLVSFVSKSTKQT